MTGTGNYAPVGMVWQSSNILQPEINQLHLALIIGTEQVQMMKNTRPAALVERLQQQIIHCGYLWLRQVERLAPPLLCQVVSNDRGSHRSTAGLAQHLNAGSMIGV